MNLVESILKESVYFDYLKPYTFKSIGHQITFDATDLARGDDPAGLVHVHIKGRATSSTFTLSAQDILKISKHKKGVLEFKPQWQNSGKLGIDITDTNQVRIYDAIDRGTGGYIDLKPYLKAISTYIASYEVADAY